MEVPPNELTLGLFFGVTRPLGQQLGEGIELFLGSFRLGHILAILVHFNSEIGEWNFSILKISINV